MHLTVVFRVQGRWVQKAERGLRDLKVTRVQRAIGATKVPRESPARRAKWGSGVSAALQAEGARQEPPDTTAPLVTRAPTACLVLRGPSVSHPLAPRELWVPRDLRGRRARTVRRVQQATTVSVGILAREGLLVRLEPGEKQARIIRRDCVWLHVAAGENRPWPRGGIVCTFLYYIHSSITAAAPKEILVPCLENYSGVHAVLPSVLGPRIRLVRARVTMRTPVHANNVSDGCRQLPCVP